jgi:hypothetical protein
MKILVSVHLQVYKNMLDNNCEGANLGYHDQARAGFCDPHGGTVQDRHHMHQRVGYINKDGKAPVNKAKGTKLATRSMKLFTYIV